LAKYPIPMADSHVPGTILKPIRALSQTIHHTIPVGLQRRGKEHTFRCGQSFGFKYIRYIKILPGDRCKTKLRAKMLLADLQVQLESNQRIIKDFGSQISYGNWAMACLKHPTAVFYGTCIDSPSEAFDIMQTVSGWPWLICGRP